MKKQLTFALTLTLISLNSQAAEYSAAKSEAINSQGALHEIAGFSNTTISFQDDKSSIYSIGGTYSYWATQSIQGTIRMAFELQGDALYFSPLIGPTFNFISDGQRNRAFFIGVLGGTQTIRSSKQEAETEAVGRLSLGSRVALTESVSWKPELAISKAIKAGSPAEFVIALIQFSIFL